jgi:hypothetical protein
MVLSLGSAQNRVAQVVFNPTLHNRSFFEDGAWRGKVDKRHLAGLDTNSAASCLIFFPLKNLERVFLKVARGKRKTDILGRMVVISHCSSTEV